MCYIFLTIKQVNSFDFTVFMFSTSDKVLQSLRYAAEYVRGTCIDFKSIQVPRTYSVAQRLSNSECLSGICGRIGTPTVTNITTPTVPTPPGYEVWGVDVVKSVTSRYEWFLLQSDA
jgi:hypothetical protein